MDGAVADAATCDGIAGADGCRCVGGTYWELRFDADPTAVDVNADGVVDWRMRDGMPFATSELSAGVWRTMRTLDTNPDANFDVSTSLHVRFRNVTEGGRGAVVWINADFRDGTFAPIHADLALQADGTQELTLMGRDDTGDVELARFSGLGADFVELWLVLDPDADTVALWLDGEPMGSYDYPTRTDPSNAFASLLGWGSEAEFDFVRIESCPDGAATPDTRVPPPPTCMDGGGVMCGGACVDPNSDASYCGASGDCAGANAGASCASAETCVSGACTAGADPRPTPDLVVSLDGVDDGTCGPVASPCRTVKYAVETRATSGQLVGVMPGTYDETGAIDVPKTVSITGMGTDASEVVLRPNYASSSGDAFVNLSDTALQQDGNQEISYLRLEGHALAYTGWLAIEVLNRNRVRIHHCRITNWDREGRWSGSGAAMARSTETLAWPSDEWYRFLPAELGSPGDYSSWTDWPTRPIKEFEFDHNYVYRAGPNQRGVSGRPGSSLTLKNAKDSSVHDNEFDLRGVFASAMRGVSAFWNNVDVYRNIFRASDAVREGWFPADARWKVVFVLETWLHINGCEWYDNITNDGFSIMNHKESSIRNNILIRDGSRAIGIEVGVMHETSVYNNYIVGGMAAGIAAAHNRTSRATNGNIFENTIINVNEWGISISASKAFCRSSALGVTGTAVYNNLVDHTRYGPLRIGPTRGCDATDAPTAPYEVMIRNNLFIEDPANSRNGIVFEPAHAYRALRSTAENNLMFGISPSRRTACRCFDTACTTACSGLSASGTIFADPEFLSPSDITIVDSMDATNTARSGIWSPAGSGELRQYQDNSLVNVGTSSSDWFEFRASDLPTDGPSLVAIWWPRNPTTSRSDAVSIEVFDGASATPLASYTIDQASWSSEQWYFLGFQTFRSGSSRVRVRSVAGAEVVADAVLWSRLGRGYRLAAGSPAIDAGSSAVESVVTEDFFGNSVPRGSAPDIGIHER
ncbi:MAG: hypothetical protein GXP55_03910 [Deltaproteobacteria bacterium]|nr:hypothetical protein [Deltaproteobacteria bacterium]